MAKLFYIFGALLCLQIVSCRVVRDTQNQIPDFSEWVKQAETALGEVHQKFLDVVGVKSNEEVVTLLQTQGKQYAEKVEGLVQHLKTEAGKTDEILQAIAATVGAAVDELKSHTESNADVQKLKEEFEKRLQTVLTETEKFETKIKEQGKDIPEELQKALKGIVDNVVETAKKVSHDVETVVKEKKQ